MATIRFDEDAESELDALYDTDEDAAATVDVLIEAISENDDALETLTRDVPKWGPMGLPPYEVKRFEEAFNAGYLIYFLKPRTEEDGELIDYRVFFAWFQQLDRYVVLATLPRSNCYDTTTDAYRCMLARYDRHLSLAGGHR